MNQSHETAAAKRLRFYIEKGKHLWPIHKIYMKRKKTIREKIKKIGGRSYNKRCK